MPKQGLQSLKLSEVSAMFAKDQQWYFIKSDGYMLTWQVDSSIPHRFTFHINQFSILTNGCDIDTLIAATDVNQHFEVSISF